MEQVLQDMKRGSIVVQNVPLPRPGPRELLVGNAFSIISSGTERAKIETGKKSLLSKALERPDQVRLVAQQIRQEGLLATWRKVKDRLEAPAPLGYASSGIVQAVGSEVKGIGVGDRVACAGAQYAHHAEIIVVPTNLCAKVPPRVDLASAATTTLGAIALQGVRQADVKLGEVVAVIGLGLIGQLTAQILHSAGCRVFGIDLDPRKVALAKTLGMEEGGLWGSASLAHNIHQCTQGYGVDAVILTASSASDDLVPFAGSCSRDKGRIVVVGQVPINLPRSPFYDKELTVLFSRAYGPGRYDPLYEENGLDYPIGYVRWTENRNMGAYLQMLERQSVKAVPLITHQFDYRDAQSAFNKLTHAEEDLVIGILLSYPAKHSVDMPIIKVREKAAPVSGKVRIGMIGAGHFGASILLPHLRSNGQVHLETLCTQHGYTAQHLGRKFGFHQATCDPETILSDPGIDAVVIATRHDTHGPFVQSALQRGKRVFVEKPLCLTAVELEEIVRLQSATRLPVMVGFNRRFSPHAQRLYQELAPLAGPRLINYRINAGVLPSDHWLNDVHKGGGRILGEVCHFIDLSIWLAGDLPEQISAQSPTGPGTEDVLVLIRFANGSQAQILYTAQGHASLSKERLEVFAAGHAFVLDNFQALTRYAPSGRRRHRSWRIQKGYREELERWISSIVKGMESPIPFQESWFSTRATILAQESLERGMPVAF